MNTTTNIRVPAMTTKIRVYTATAKIRVSRQSWGRVFKVATHPRHPSADDATHGYTWLHMVHIIVSKIQLEGEAHSLSYTD
jgi:hypothetical protein